MCVKFSSRLFSNMHGNVWELVANAFQFELPGGIDPFVDRVLRGGAAGNHADAVRTANRLGASPSFHYGNAGFRLARAQP